MGIADIIRMFLNDMEQQGQLNPFQKKVLKDIIACRTPELGGHIMACKNCGCTKATYNSCNNRHCPNCGSYKRDKWSLMRKSEALPVKYFHVVFTLPQEFNTLFRQAPRDMYNTLFEAAWGAVKIFADDHKYLGAKPGMVAVLHTWGQNISLHPHLHCIVPGGGITKQGKWRCLKKSNGKFLFPVKALSTVFKAKFCKSVSRLIKQGKIKAPKNIKDHYTWINKLYLKNWVVYAKKPVPTGAPVVEYIGRYTHKVAISNSRIRAISNGKVTFSWFDYKTSKVKNIQLDGPEFIRRYLLHLLPKKFVKIRYYGFLSNKSKTSDIKKILKDLRVLVPVSPKGLP